MARPTKLIKRELLTKLWFFHKEGVPVSKLVKQNDLDISQPTLAKLLSFMTKADESPPDVASIIDNSLFPDWLETGEGDCVTQPGTHYYKGVMPLGKWQRYEWAEEIKSTNPNKLTNTEAEKILDFVRGGKDGE